MTACETTYYLGDTYTPNRDVKIFYNARDIKREYKVIGHITGVVTADQEKTKQNIVNRAIMVGADAVIFNEIAFTGGKESSAVQKADAIKFTDKEPGKKDTITTTN